MLTHKGTVPLYTPRLVLRRLRLDDAQAIFDNWARDEQVAKYMSWSAHASVEVTKAVLSAWVSDYANENYYHWAIEKDSVIIGTIGVHHIETAHERCEIGYCIGRKWWGMGVMTEAVAEIIRFCFEELGFYKVGAFHDVKNIGSGKVMIKNNMNLESLLKEHNIRKDGTRADVAYRAILRSDWERSSAQR